jgi:hypothetical protein
LLVTQLLDNDHSFTQMPEGPALTKLRKEIARLEAEPLRQVKMPAFVPVTVKSHSTTTGQLINH